MIESIIVWLIIGAIAGWAAGLIMKGYGFGLVGNIIVGIIGTVIAGWLLPLAPMKRPRRVVSSLLVFLLPCSFLQSSRLQIGRREPWI